MTDTHGKDRQRLKKYAVFAVMLAAFGGCIWLIFAPSAIEKQKQAQLTGYNRSIPEPEAGGIIGDKRGAYQQEDSRRRQEGQMVSLDAFSSLTGEADSSGGSAAIAAGNERGEAAASGSAIGSSAASYRDINRSLGTFYESPREDKRGQEILALEWRVQELEKALQEKDSRQEALEGQAELMEKSYQLAARYMPQSQTAGSVQYPGEDGTVESRHEGPGAGELKNRITGGGSTGKAKVSALGQAADRTVSLLAQDHSGDEIMELYDRPRNYGFNTLRDEKAPSGKNTIRACIHGDQAVLGGQSVFIRLLEPAAVEGAVIPAGTVLAAKSTLGGERLELEISSIEYEGAIYPVKVSVFDTDGVKGVYVPGSMELDALKEVAAGMGSAVGSSFTMTQNAGAQIASDLTKGVIQGASQYFAKKVRMVRVNLKAGHKLLLYPEKQ